MVAPFAGAWIETGRTCHAQRLLQRLLRRRQYATEMGLGGIQAQTLGDTVGLLQAGCPGIGLVVR